MVVDIKQKMMIGKITKKPRTITRGAFYNNINIKKKNT